MYWNRVTDNNDEPLRSRTPSLATSPLKPHDVCISLETKDKITNSNKPKHNKWNNYIVCLWILSFNLFGFSADKYVVLYYIILSLWTYYVILTQVGHDLIYELVLLKYTLRETLLLLAVLVTENGLMYVISYIDSGKNLAKGLADPPRDILLSFMRRKHHYFRVTFLFLKRNCFTTHSTYFVSWAIILCFSAFWMKYKKDDRLISGSKLGVKYLRSIVFGHGARTISFMLTILPSQFYGCFISRFSRESMHEIKKIYPDSIERDAYIENMHFEFDWKAVVLRKPGGGCNDLIWSGHYVIIMNTVLLFNEVYRNYCKSNNIRNQKMHIFVLLYLICNAIFTGLDMIIYKHHYSVDVYIAVIVSILFWKYVSHPSAYWFVDLELKSDSVQQEIKKSWIAWLFKKFGIDSLRKQRIFFTALLLPILLIVYIIFLPGT